MNINDAIQSLVPGARPNIDYIVQDNADGKGPFIAVWRHPTAPQPTADQLANAPPLVPQIVTAVQARIALTAAGKRTTVENAVQAASQDVKDYWEFSLTLGRQHPVLLQMANSLGWSSTDLDNLFIAAGQVPT
jgi:hypothetical protein